MAKPDTGVQSEFVKIAVGELLGVIKGHVANNPKMDQEEKMHALVEGTGAFHGIAAKIQLGDNQQLAARPVGDMSKSNEVQIG